MCSENLVAAVFVIILGLSACAPALHVPDENDAREYNISLDTLKTGRQLYVKNCGNCHNLYLPEKYTSQEWMDIMDIMQEPAKIDNVKKQLIYLYLASHSKK